MKQLVYVSNTSRDLPGSTLEDILSCSRRNNALLGVSGMLLYVDGGFLQILEGEDGAVDRLYAKIGVDKRHWNTQLLLQREAPRAFCDWSMGFFSPTAEDQAEMFRISKSAITGHLSSSEQPLLLRLLENFYRIQTGEPAFPGLDF